MFSIIKRKIRKLLIGGRWHVMYRPVNSQSPFIMAENPPREFCADPMIIEENGDTYIFCEQFREKDRKGCEGYFKFENGVPVNKGIILERPYHLSYPFVFKYRGCYYMIPETSENNTVELYNATSFPNKWEFCRVILKGHDYVDTTVMEENGVMTFVTYYTVDDGYVLEKYAFDENLDRITLLTTIHYKENIGRGAGQYFMRDNILYRPSQNCIRAYGEGMFINKVFSKGTQYKEEIVSEMTLNNTPIQGLRRKVAMHTYSVSSKYEVIDVFAERFDICFNLGNLLAKKRRVKSLQK